MGEYKLVEWGDIKDDFTDCLLLGNGASIAINQGFSYSSLLEEARHSDYITQNIDRLFNHFQTEDFEFILRMLWNTYHVNHALDFDEQRTLEVYEQVKDALIRVVRKIHIPYGEIEGFLPKISNFLKQFDTVLSLNYDLLVYWAFLYANEKDETVRFKDCFPYQQFDDDWERFRESIRPVNKSILVFYPHGNLALATDISGTTTKIARQGPDEYLIDRILDNWEAGHVTPLFVSEGDSEQKVKAILRNYYLSSVYKDVLPEEKESIVIYGWSMSINDDHILEELLSSGAERIAVSVYTGDGNWQNYCHFVYRKIKSSLKGQRNIELVFYNSGSEGCWNN